MMGKSHILVECDTQVNDSGGTGNIGIHEFDVDRRETLNVLSRAKNGRLSLLCVDFDAVFAKPSRQ